ncbi:MAG TPA: GTP-binding protein, partial [Pseudorhodoferax sp.]|nr:GTP-binding protein [Pseudorhodoferax sp.]
MIVGTAGHIDHGKTTLVRALTGVDTDRLPEEKKRGISIELGYAFLDLPALPDAAEAAHGGGRIGFIDVPGHERLVHTMLSGATGIDFGLLLVAADDGVMPQTREHLAVLALLGVDRGAVAITKCDRADAARRAAVQADVAALLAGTPLAGCPVQEVSATTGAGVDALRALLVQAARAHQRQDDPHAAFRLAVDRAFTLPGTGTVVTGTV